MDASDQLSEFEAYKIKTKEWQAKVKDRDLKMRAQLESLTESLSAKSTEISDLQQKVQMSETIAQQMNDLKQRYQEKELAREELAIKLASKDLALEALTQELKDKDARCQALSRDRENAQAKVAEVEANRLNNSEATVLSSSDRTVRVVVEVEGYGSHYFSTGGGSSCWLTSPMGGAGTIPVSLNQQLSSAAQALDTHKVQLEALRRSLELEQTQSHKLRSEYSLSETSKMDLSEQRHRELIANRCASEYLQIVLAAESRRRIAYIDTIQLLQTEKKELTEYKSKAQLLLRSRPSDDDAAKLLKQRAQDLEAEVAAYRDENTKLLEQAQLLAKSEKAECEAHARHVAELNIEFERQQDELRRTLLLNNNPTTTEPPKVTVGKSIQTTIQNFAHAHSQTQTFVECQPQPVLTSAPAPPVSSTNIKSSLAPEPSSEFSLQNLLSANESSPANVHAVHPTRSPLDDNLRSEVRRLAVELSQSKSEIRDLTLQEQRYTEQLTLLKEQLRAVERSNQLDKDLTHHGEYLKNVVVKLLTVQDSEIKRGLIPIIGDILHFTPAELHALMSA